MSSIDSIKKLQEEAFHHMEVMEKMMMDRKSEAEILEYGEKLKAVNEKMGALTSVAVSELKDKGEVIRKKHNRLMLGLSICTILMFLVLAAKVYLNR